MSRFLHQVRNTGFLLRSGVIGPLLFVAIFLVEGLTRPDYDPFRSMVSELSLSDWGWQQIANFLMCGTLMLAFCFGLRRVEASRWAARILTVTALGMLMAGVFVCDPGLAYPAGAPNALPVGTGTWHGLLHGIAGAIVFFSLPLAIGFMAVWFARNSERGWFVYSMATLLIGFAAFMASNIAAMHGGPAGLFQRVAIITYFIWLSLLAHYFTKHVRSRTPVARVSGSGPGQLSPNRVSISRDLTSAPNRRSVLAS